MKFVFWYMALMTFISFLGCCVSINQIGKERKPVTANAIVIALILFLVQLGCMIYWGIQ